jgi:hypothetical protein
MREIVPIADRPTHLVEAGRLRMGEKHGKAMRALDKWRLTSARPEFLEDAAAKYGGTVRKWHEPRANPPDQFELYTAVDTLDVAIIPNGFSAHYEEWGGGGVLKRCDGTNVAVPVRVGDDDVEMQMQPCICRAQGAATCRPYVRLSVVLPGVRFGGVWRLETKSWNALDEISAMEAMVTGLQEHGITAAKLSISKRTTKIAGRTRHFVVPVLWVDMSPEDIAIGKGSLRALATGADVAAIGPGNDSTRPAAVQAQVGPPGVDRGPENGEWWDTDSNDGEVIDAELIDDDEAAPAGEAETVTPTQLRPRIDRMRSKLAIECNGREPEPGDSDDLRHAVSWYVSKGRTRSSKELDEAELSEALDRITKAKPSEIEGLLASYRKAK